MGHQFGESQDDYERGLSPEELALNPDDMEDLLPVVSGE